MAPLLLATRAVLACVVTGIALFALPPDASAGASVFTDRPAWAAASEHVSTVTFEGLAPPAHAVSYRTAAGLTVGDLTFLGTYDGGNGYYLAVVDAAFYFEYNWESGATLQGPALSGGLGAGGPNAKIRITLPPGTTAFGTDLMAYARTDIPITLTLSTGESFTQRTLARPARAFLGVTSDVDIAYVDISTTEDVYTELDNVSVGDKIFGGPHLTSLVLKKTLVPGCKAVSGTVSLSEAAPAGGLAITLSDSLVSAKVPATVTVPAGATSKSFSVKTTPVAADESGTVSATLGATSLDAALTVRPISVTSLALTPTTVSGGTPVNGTVKLECAAQPAAILVELASNHTDVAFPAAGSVLIPAGAKSAPIVVTTLPVEKASKATISATANGLTKGKALKVTP